MDASEPAELRTTYIFGPAEGSTWGLTYEGIEAKLRERETDTFVRIDEGEKGPVRGSAMHFGITVGEEELEGMAKLSPEGIAIEDCTAHAAAEFVKWLWGSVVPDGSSITFNTEWGLEADLPDALVPHVSRPRLVATFLAHLEATGGLD
ncbi:MULTISPECIES: hypothetical protein [unclassified Streptomyces]|uniref:hypothetical protein n=1 Tax=unclassified Streptomyces TaxID=2593676 RepID=UPI0006FC6ECA|nr:MULTISPECIES: hypothetical protein [unclassified Streptomyces]KQX51500.1 hypothetical protein ASD33_33435 [Streptomyces sp. Root1304]KRA85919.1 hypothetical protein ASE09_33415 [Streptomyces sp. Root66D1]